MRRVIDLERNQQAGEQYPEYRKMAQNRPGNPVADRLPRPEGYGFDNCANIFRNPPQASRRHRKRRRASG